ncbi:MAG: hypothetical protein KJ607_00310, partial [Bacteroidetes bacterium]|nr:hypothetical protein [Bacteroidota bacterium]
MLQGKSAFSTFFSLAKQYAFWMFFFASCRAIFLLYNFRLLKEAGIGEAVQSFWHALYLDNSITCYILIFPFVLMFFQSLVKHPFLCIANKVYSIILISVFSLLIVSELEIFREWGVKLNYKAMSYLVRPAEVFETARPVFLIAGILVAGLHSFLWIFLYHRFVFQKIRMRRRRYLFSALFLIIAPFLLFGGIRGGTQPIPIQISDVYFSKNNFINLATVNSLFHLGSSFDKNWRYRGVNPF